MSPRRYVLLPFVLLSAIALAIALRNAYRRPALGLGISFAGYTNSFDGYIARKCVLLSVSNAYEFPVQWCYLSAELEGGPSRVPLEMLLPSIQQLQATPLKRAGSSLLVIAEPQLQQNGRWRVNFDFVPNTLWQRLLFSLQHRVPRPLLRAVISSPYRTANSSWLVCNPAPAPIDIRDFNKVYLLVEDPAPGNSVLAAQWLGRAAGNGNGDAQRLLGRMYALGQGVPKNAATAERWLGKAAAQSIPEALSDLQIFSRHRAAVQEDAGPPLFEAVTPQQMLEAKIRASQLTP